MIPGKNFPPTNKKPHPHYMNRDGLRALEHITEFSVCIIKILSWWKHLHASGQAFDLQVGNSG